MPAQTIAIKVECQILSAQTFMHPPFLFSALPYLFLSITLPHALALGTGGPVLNANIRAFIYHLLAEYESPGGIGVAVVSQDSSGVWNVETKGYGVATLANGNNVTENTLFPIGSNSKVISGVNVLVIFLMCHHPSCSISSPQDSSYTTTPYTLVCRGHRNWSQSSRVSAWRILSLASIQP